MQDQAKKKRDYKREATYKWQKTCSLTKSEGETLETIMMQYSCNNLSQLCKKIVKGEILLSQRNA